MNLTFPHRSHSVPRTISPRFKCRLPQLPFLFCALVVTGCEGDPTEPELTLREVGVVVASTDISLTVFDVEDPSITRTIGLGPDGSPVSLATRGRLAAVPLGIVPAVAIVDLVEASLLRTVALPSGSGATGVAFVNDSIALVANPGLNTVTPVNVLSGLAGTDIDVGTYPQAIVVADGRAYVVNANLANFAPAGPSSLTIIDGATLLVEGEITLTGENASAASVGPGGTLYVIHSGTWGMNDGSLSVVNLSSRTETAHVAGFGNFPGSVEVDERSLVYVGVFGVGTLVWDALTTSFVHDSTTPLTPDGIASTSGVGHDSEGRLYTLTPDCQLPANAHRLSSNYSVELSVPVGRIGRRFMMHRQSRR
jgi:hypothetical protein